jgi:hypothetical protein
MQTTGGFIIDAPAIARPEFKEMVAYHFAKREALFKEWRKRDRARAKARRASKNT